MVRLTTDKMKRPLSSFANFRGLCFGEPPLFRRQVNGELNHTIPDKLFTLRIEQDESLAGFIVRPFNRGGRTAMQASTVSAHGDMIRIHRSTNKSLDYTNFTSRGLYPRIIFESGDTVPGSY